MYIETIVSLKIAEFEAVRNHVCSYCDPGRRQNALLKKDIKESDKKIREGERLFWVEGSRYYRHFGKPHVPYHLRRDIRRRKISYSDYCENITFHQMCGDCFKKMINFFHGRYALDSNTGLFLLNSSYYLKYQRALYSYRCICCNGDIEQGQMYARRGNAAYTNNVCDGCHQLLYPIIGSEWAN